MPINGVFAVAVNLRIRPLRFSALNAKPSRNSRILTFNWQATTVPGVGPVVSLAYVSTIDIPSRFRHSRAVGAVLGLTPVLNQSGESKRIGHVSLCGDAMMRALLYEAAQTMLTRVVKWCWLKAWAMGIARRHGRKKANVALARRLAVVMHRMWVDGSEFRWTREATAGAMPA